MSILKMFIVKLIFKWQSFKAHLLIPGFMVSNILKFVIIGFIIIIKMPTLNLKLTLITDYNY